GPTLRYESSLLHLPVPTIFFTAAKYLESSRLHLTPAEFATTKVAVNAFVTKVLQERLQALSADPGCANRLAGWWNEVVYMG
ncbi:uncharacterized protein BXZ73DRAFT_55382, partial [Epithele typhae]|uniref:uncharacterized protein n=1 Tax=Epithele typhae TaxID=378194 RepID=UPI0020074FDF